MQKLMVITTYTYFSNDLMIYFNEDQCLVQSLDLLHSAPLVNITQTKSSMDFFLFFYSFTYRRLLNNAL